MEKATLFARHLEMTFQYFSHNPTDESEEKIKVFLYTPYQIHTPEKFTTNKVTKFIMERINPKKSPAQNMITKNYFKRRPMKQESY